MGTPENAGDSALARMLHIGEVSGLIRIAQVLPEIEYIFRHQMVQQAAYHSLLKQDRRTLHAAVAEALERLYSDRSDELAATLAHHFQRADQPERAVLYFERAIESALASYANPVAESLCLEALTLAISDEVRAALFARLGEACYRQDRFEEALTAWQHAIPLYREPGDSDSVCRLYARSVRANTQRSHDNAAVELARSALQDLEGQPDSAGMAALLHEAARACFFGNQREGINSLLERALDMARATGAVEVEADTLVSFMYVPDMSLQEKRFLLERAAALADEGGFLDVAVRAHGNLVKVAEDLNELDAVLRHNHEGLRFARRSGSPIAIFSYLGNLMLYEVWWGNLVEAEALFASLVETFHDLPEPAAMQSSLAMYEAQLCHQSGDLEAARILYEESIALAQVQGDEHRWQNALAMLGQVLVEQGEWVPAGALLQECVMRWHDDDTWQACLVNRCRAYLGQQRLDEARRLLDDPRSVVRNQGSVLDTEVTLCRAHIAASEGQLTEANAHFARALEVFDSLHARSRSASTLRQWGEAIIGLDRTQARAVLSDAIAAYDSMGAPLIVSRIRMVMSGA